MRTSLAVAVLFLSACAGAPPAPDWQINAHSGLREFSLAYLEGNSRLAETAFARARAELSRTGRPDLVARAELVRCATRVASVEFDDCPGFTPLAGDAGAAERAYAAFLSGHWQELDATLLPPQYRELVARDCAPGTVAGIDDAMSRLIAAGACLRHGSTAPADIAAATETASASGWRRPLLAWLGITQQRAEKAGDRDAAAYLRRRIDLVGGTAGAAAAR